MGEIRVGRCERVRLSSHWLCAFASLATTTFKKKVVEALKMRGSCLALISSSDGGFVVAILVLGGVRGVGGLTWDEHASEGGTRR